MELLNQMDGFDQTVNVKVRALLPWSDWALLRAPTACAACMLGSGNCRLRCKRVAHVVQLRGAPVVLQCTTGDVAGPGRCLLLVQQRSPSGPVPATLPSWLNVCAVTQVIMATNRADTLDPALLRPGRLDRKIEFPMPDRRQKRLVFQVLTPDLGQALVLCRQNWTRPCMCLIQLLLMRWP